MKLIKMKCESCGAILDVNKSLEKITCNYCGEEILIDDEATKVKRVEEAKLKARKDNHEQSLKERNDNLEQEVKEKKIKDELNSVENFKKGKFSKVLLVFFAIAVLFFFIGDGFLVKFLTLIQAGAFICAWLMGMKILKEPFKGLKIILAILGFILIVPIINTGGDTTSSYDEKPTKLDVSDVELIDYFPVPDKLYGVIDIDRKDMLSIEIYDITKKEYKAYVNKVIDAGYTIDLEYENWDDVYGAFNEEGYSIRILFSDYDEDEITMDITLEAPEEMEEIDWPKNGLGSNLPKPKSNLGNISWNNIETFIAHIGNMTIDDYNDYVEECEDKGFTIDYSKDKKYYSAKNKYGYELTLRYLGANVIEIALDASVISDEDENITTEKEDKTNNKKEESSDMVDGMRKEFKEAMDSYEEFIDEYIVFMKKYSDSNSMDAELLKDYSIYMSKYTKSVEAFEKWEDDDLNPEEESYYIKVQTRVSKKLLEVAY